MNQPEFPRTHVHTLGTTTELGALVKASGGALGIVVARGAAKWTTLRPNAPADPQARELARTLVELAVACGFERTEVQAATVLELPKAGGQGRLGALVAVWGIPVDPRFMPFQAQVGAYIDERFGGTAGQEA